VATTDTTEHERPRRGRAAASAAPGFSVRRRTGRWRDALRRRYLAAADVAAVLLAGAVSGALGASPVLAAASVPLWIVLAKLYGLYDRDHRVMRHLTSDEIGGLIAWAATGALVLLGLAELTSQEALGAAEGVELVLALVLLAPLSRAIARRLWRATVPPERVLVVGSGALARSTRRKLEILGDAHQELVGDAIEPGDVADPQRARATLDAILAERALHRVIVASETLAEEVIVGLVVACRERLLKLGFVPPAHAALGTAAQLGRLAELPVVDCLTWDPPRSTLLLKRMLDVAVSAVLLVVALPLMLLVAAIVRLTSGGPVLFRQRRAGVDGAPFWMCKFRTMDVDAERRLEDLVAFDDLAEPAFKLEHDPRVTRVGRFLRRTSFDELPQLVNVLRGQMSLVGPRPEQVELVARYTEAERARLAVKPGMTGPMQVLGRGRLDFEERLRLERDYIETLSITNDVRILMRTIGSVLSGRGAS
jgi:exopolysaccharide biosynthesis polyprenyl glycosylphosphotransferase